jgi:hypothetical protein
MTDSLSRITEYWGCASILLANGSAALIDVEDFDILARWRWRLNEWGYARTGGTRSLIATTMHRLLMREPDGMTVDHINGNKLDNRKSNLRVCTSSENYRNRRKQSGQFTSRYKGVHWDSKNKKWSARIQRNGKSYRLGYFNTELEAALAYNEAAPDYHGQFANLNIIGEAS